MVVLMPRGKVPYVLRRVMDHDKGGSKNADEPRSEYEEHKPSVKQTMMPQYPFLGDAYVQGIMDGEAFDQSKLQIVTLIRQAGSYCRFHYLT